MGSRVALRKILFLDPILGWVDLAMILCMIFTHGLGRDCSRSIVFDAMVFGPWYWMLKHI